MTSPRTKLSPSLRKPTRNLYLPPREHRELFDLGVMGMVVPGEFGGAQALTTCPPLSLSKSCQSSALPPAISSLPTMVCAAARSFANGTPPHRREKYLRMLTEGHKVGAFRTDRAGPLVLTLQRGTCVAELQGDHYVTGTAPRSSSTTLRC